MINALLGGFEFDVLRFTIRSIIFWVFFESVSACLYVRPNEISLLDVCLLLVFVYIVLYLSATTGGLSVSACRGGRASTIAQCIL